MDGLCVTVTPQTTPTRSQFTIRNTHDLGGLGEYHVMCQVIQHPPLEYNINAITITSAGVLTVTERPGKPQIEGEGTSSV